MSPYLLSIICYIPLAGAIILAVFVNKSQHRFIRWFSTGVALLDFAFSLILWFRWPSVQPNADGMRFVERTDWITPLAIEYYFGIDGISLLLILLTTLLGFVAILSSWRAITERLKEFHVFVLFLQTGMLGVFMALDFFLFYVFWEIMLVPMYFLIGIWGDERRLYAAIKFFLFTLFGSVLMLLGLLALYFYNTSGLLWWDGLGNPATFSIPHFQEIAGLIPMKLQFWIFIGFFFAFAIKVPMFPLHTWLPDAHVEAPTAGSVLLAGVLLKMGTYGFVRIAMPILPQGTHFFLPWLVTLALISIIYGGLVAMVQKDWKSLVAYSSISHLGFVMLGIFTMNQTGIEGGLLQMINHGINTGALFLIVGIVYEQRHTRLIKEYQGLSAQMPVFAAIFGVMAMASLGLPGLNGFVGEFMILLGAFSVSWIWASIAALGIIIGAAYILWLFQRVMFGPLEKPENKQLRDIGVRELIYFVPLVILAVWIGIYPMPFLEKLEAPSMKLVEQMRPVARGTVNLNDCDKTLARRDHTLVMEP